MTKQIKDEIQEILINLNKPKGMKDFLEIVNKVKCYKDSKNISDKAQFELQKAYEEICNGDLGAFDRISTHLIQAVRNIEG